MHVVRQVLLACYLSVFGCEFFEECYFPSDAMEVKETFRARVTIPEPGGRANLVVPRYLLLQCVGQVSLRLREYAPDWFVFGISLQLDFR